MSMTNSKKSIRARAPHAAAAAPTTTLLKEIGNIPKDSRRSFSVKKEKPLRERVSEQQLTQKLHQPDAASRSLINNGGPATVTEREAAGQFVWATKYRPKALKDFICNRDTAISLQGQVRTGIAFYVLIS